MAHKFNFLAFKWSVTVPFHEYLYGNTLTVKYDNNPLTYVWTTAWLDDTGHHWVAWVAVYNFNIQYEKDKTIIEADALSRVDWGEKISAESVKVILNMAMEGMSTLAEVCAHSFQVCSNMGNINLAPQHVLKNNLAETQLKYANFQEIIYLYQKMGLDTAKLANYESLELKALLWPWLWHMLCQEVFYLKAELHCEDYNDMRLGKLPKYQLLAMQGWHDDLGHLGLEQMLDLLRDWLYLPGMQDDAEKHVWTFERCLKFKSRPQHEEPCIL